MRSEKTRKDTSTLTYPDVSYTLKRIKPFGKTEKTEFVGPNSIIYAWKRRDDVLPLFQLLEYPHKLVIATMVFRSIGNGLFEGELNVEQRLDHHMTQLVVASAFEVNHSQLKSEICVKTEKKDDLFKDVGRYRRIRCANTMF